MIFVTRTRQYASLQMKGTEVKINHRESRANKRDASKNAINQ